MYQEPEKEASSVSDRFHLAQVNIALPRAPRDTPLLAEFMALLDPINAIADRSPGFVWRLQTEDGDATAVRAFGDDRLIVNMSVWESIETWADFVYRSGHAEVMKRRREWFERVAEGYQCLWWIPAGEIPTVTQAEERLDHLRRHGPTAFAFTARARYEPRGAQPIDDPECELWTCPAG
jgi:hypothetical protein